MTKDAVDDTTAFVSIATPAAINDKDYSDGVVLLDPNATPTPTATPQAPEPQRMVPVSQLFVYADAVDWGLMVIGSISALATGFAQPYQFILYGDVINAFNPASGVSMSTMRDAINDVALKFVYVGLATIACGFLEVACWAAASTRQSQRIRSAYVQAVLSKDIGWFDTNDAAQLPAKIVGSTVTMQEGMGHKIGESLQYLSMGASGLIIGVVHGWQLALILLAFVPFIALAAGIMVRAIVRETKGGLDSAGKAGAVAQEALGNIRTVHMFNAITYFVEKYESALVGTTRAGIARQSAIGMGMGLMFFACFSTYAGGLYYGAVRIADDQLTEPLCTGDNCYDGGRVITVFMSIIMGAMAIGQAAPALQTVFAARVAATDVFEVIYSVSDIDPLSDDGLTLPQVEGKIEFIDVTFAYPSRPQVNVCERYSLLIAPGETVALVGPSGSGKSTVVSLLERFYDPQAGSVLFDGHDLRDLNVRWLRQQIGLVGQEPILFATSIRENIRHGQPSASDAEVEDAARRANAFDFILTFPQGFDTEVGERGTQLSGGQKQRIAIARAILKNPTVLLLDEATSALDAESEHMVQESLDMLLASTCRTTIIVAHRLSTVRHANMIVVHRDGTIVESGTHTELMELRDGLYRRMVETQTFTPTTTADDGRCETPPDQRQQEKAEMASPNAVALANNVADQVEPASTPRQTEETLVLIPSKRLWVLNFPEWPYAALGVVGSMINACTYPVWGVLLAKMTTLFFERLTPSQMRHDARMWSVGFVVLGVVYALSVFASYYGFAVAAQRLVARVRVLAFQSMLRQEVGWFDQEQNSSGALIDRLVADTSTLQSATSEVLRQSVVYASALAAAFGISFYYSWRMALAMMAILPVLAFSSYVSAQQVGGGGATSKESSDGNAAAGALLTEAIGAIRTVASFGLESAVQRVYTAMLQQAEASDLRNCVFKGGAFGLSIGVTFFSMAFVYWLGAKWVTEGILTFEQMYIVQMAVILSMLAVGIAAQSLADGGNARAAIARVFQVIDRLPLIDAESHSGRAINNVMGDIVFDNVNFAYPARPDHPVYSGYSLHIARGATVALVGASGSGKSTAIALLERFYDVDTGRVTLDGHDLRTLNLHWLRDHVSLVSQEPVLFGASIRENIAMGKPSASDEEIVEAARMANAHDFISAFPEGYDTQVGEHGTLISGGQKQRIAIARAIVRDPEVLLLDEATSALDNESERVVQGSLDHLLESRERTTIVVAHRLSTIRFADKIEVLKHGKIVEQGTHDELMRNTGGFYRPLVERQLCPEQQDGQ